MILFLEISKIMKKISFFNLFSVKKKNQYIYQKKI
jgi:hypothetical protein